MNLASHYINDIASTQLNGIKNNNAVTGLDLNDNTFENMLQKQLDNSINTNDISQTANFGVPTGFDIGDLDGRVLQFNSDGAINQINNTESSGFDFSGDVKEHSVSEILTFFPSLFDSKPSIAQNATNGLFDFERKFAANSYGKYAKNIVMNLGEFVSDAINAR